MSQVQDHEVSFSLEVNVETTEKDIRRVQTLLYRTLGLMRRFGLPEEVDFAIRKIQGLIAMLNTLRLTLLLLQAQAGPVGWALAIVGFAGGAMAAGDMMFEVNNG